MPCTMPTTSERMPQQPGPLVLVVDDDPALRLQVVERIRDFGVQTLGWKWIDYCQSPIQGPAGNVEFLSYWRKPSS